MSAKKLLKKIVTLSDDKKAENIVAMDVSSITSLSEYFVVCSASNLIQVKAIADNIKDNIDEHAWKTEGYENGTWIILDYVDIVVHIFLNETREYYDLERIWFDAKVIKV